MKLICLIEIKYNLVGVTGALSGVLSRAVAEFGVEILPVISIISGILILFCYVLHLESFIVLIPSSVENGFTLGVAITLTLSQLNFALGLPYVHPKESFIETVWENLRLYEQANLYACLMFACTFVILFLLAYKWPKIPWVILFTIIGIVIGICSFKKWIPIEFELIESRFGRLTRNLIYWPVFKESYIDLRLVSSAISVAFISVLESLISAKKADGKTETAFYQGQEVFGLGLANIIGGLFGGLAATAAMTRTSMSIKLGAQSRWSGIYHALTVFVLSMIFIEFFSYLPLAMIGAITSVKAIKLIQIRHLRILWRLDKVMFGMTILTATICIVKSPTIGLICGMIMSLLKFTEEVSRINSEAVMKDEEGHDVSVQDPNNDQDSQTALPDQQQQLEHTNQNNNHNENTSQVSMTELIGHTVVYRIAAIPPPISGRDHRVQLHSPYPPDEWLVDYVPAGALR
jgi:SulP family sulfate permease